MLLSPAAAVAVALVLYDLRLEVSPGDGTLSGTARVELEATDEPLASVRFSLNERLALRAVERDGAAARFAEGERIAEGRAIDVTFDPPLEPGKRASLVFRYDGRGMDPDAEGPDWMGILLVRPDEIRMSHQAQWYPIVPLDERATNKLAAPVQLELVLPRGMESLGPGRLESTKRKGDVEVHRWTSERPVRPSILAGAYEAVQAKSGKLAVRVLAFGDRTEGAKRWGEEAAAALEALQKRLGKLDRASYGIGAMRVRNRSRSYNYEADGFSVYDEVLFGRDPDPGKIAHEVAHLWWGGAVDPAGPAERFLTESLAEVTAWLYLEERDGADAAAQAARARAARYFPSADDEHAVAQTGFASPRYVQVVYAKGAMALRTLRDQIGAQAFDEALAAYVASHSRDADAPPSELDDLLAALRAALPAERRAEVDAWADDWLRRPGAPRYRVELDERGPGRARGRLVQTGDLYRNPIEVELVLASGAPVLVRVEPTALEQPFEADVPRAVVETRIDPRALVLCERP